MKNDIYKCIRCCKIAEFTVTERYYTCGNCGYVYDLYNHEDGEPEIVDSEQE